MDDEWVKANVYYYYYCVMYWWSINEMKKYYVIEEESVLLLLVVLKVCVYCYWYNYWLLCEVLLLKYIIWR